jgi:hypothetical protein
MKNFAVIALLLGTGAVPVLADVTYDFTYDGSHFQATGTLDVNGSGLAVSGSGTLTYTGIPGSGTTAITLFPLNAAMLADPAANGVRANDGTDWNQIDNQVNVGSNPVLDGYGLIFWTGNTVPVGALADLGNHPALNEGLAPADQVVGLYAIYGNGPGSYGSFGALGTGSDATKIYGSDSGSFSLSPAGAVPDGGTTLAFLGLAVAGLAGLRRKLSI